MAALSRDVLLTNHFKTPVNRVQLSRNPTSASTDGLGYSAFARHYLRNHNCFLFLQLLRCFSSLGSLHKPIYSVYGTPINRGGLSHSEISGSQVASHLPEAYRRLLRPSSLFGVKAFTIRISITALNFSRPEGREQVSSQQSLTVTRYIIPLKITAPFFRNLLPTCVGNMTY